MKILVSAGEASGDMHAANVLRALRADNEALTCYGMGGREAASCGMELIVDYENHAVMGFVEVLKKYPALRANLNDLKQLLTERRPDVVLLVDYPTFNMKLAAAAAQLNIPTVYYIAPKVWASRPKRIEKLAQTVSHLAVIFPFEEPLFRNANIQTTYVGNPLLDNLSLIKAANGTPTVRQGTTVALMPGSRKSEITNLLPVFLQTARMLKTEQPDIRIVLPLAPTISRSMIEDCIAKTTVPVELIDSDDYTTLKQCDLALVASGTATLELAILGVPMIVTYRMNPLSYFVLKRWLTIDQISLVNIVAENAVVPELLQDDVNPENLFSHAKALLGPKAKAQDQRTALRAVTEKLGSSGAAIKVSQLIRQCMNDTKPAGR